MYTKVVVAGRISSHKGINLPGVAVSLPALTEKDEEDLRWAIRTGADIIAMAFVRFATDNGAEQQPERPEPALVLMPCTNLESLERMANRRGEKALVLMTGRVFAYEGRNYLMPTFFVEELDREGNLVPSP